MSAPEATPAALEALAGPDTFGELGEHYQAMEESVRRFDQAMVAYHRQPSAKFSRNLFAEGTNYAGTLHKTLVCITTESDWQQDAISGPHLIDNGITEWRGRMNRVAGFELTPLRRPSSAEELQLGSILELPETDIKELMRSKLYLYAMRSLLQDLSTFTTHAQMQVEGRRLLSQSERHERIMSGINRGIWLGFMVVTPLIASRFKKDSQ